MPIYTAYFRSDQDWAERDIDAATSAEALALARTFYTERSELLAFQSYDNVASVHEISIQDGAGDEVAVWQDEDLRLRLAASDLLQALDQARQALNTAPRFAVPSLGCDSYDIAALCDRTIAAVSGPVSETRQPEPQPDQGMDFERKGSRSMPNYAAYYYTTNVGIAIHHVEAETPERALEVARRMYEEHSEKIFDQHPATAGPLYGIEIWNGKYVEAAYWSQDSDQLPEARGAEPRAPQPGHPHPDRGMDFDR